MKLLIQIYLTLAFTISSASGQPAGGTVQGIVIDLELKDSVYGASAVLLTVDGKYTRFGAQTERNGHFQIPNIKTGIYKLKTFCIGYHEDTLGPITITADTLLNFIIQLDPYFGPDANDAHRDLDSGKIQIFLVAWPLYSKEQVDLAKHYGFEIAYTGCTPMWTSRYDSVVINYLKSRNGEHWYDEFIKEWTRLGKQDQEKR